MINLSLNAQAGERLSSLCTGQEDSFSSYLGEGQLLTFSEEEEA